MTDFDQAWADADPDAMGEDTGPPAPGSYTVTLIEAGAFTSKKGDAIVKLRLAHAEHTWTVIQGFASPQQANFSKKVCRDIGVDIDTVKSLEALDTQLGLLVNRRYDVDVAENGPYVNTYLRGLADDQLPGMDAVPAGAVPEDDIPF